MGVVGHYLEYGDPLGGDMDMVPAQIVRNFNGVNLGETGGRGAVDGHPRNLVPILDSVKRLTISKKVPET